MRATSLIPTVSVIYFFTIIFICTIVTGNIVCGHDPDPQSQNDNCKSVDDEPGRCVTLKACPSFVDVLRKRPIHKSDLRFLVKHTCHFDLDDPKVCCPLDEIREPKYTRFRINPSFTEPEDISYSSHPNFDLIPSLEECSIQLPQINRIAGGKIAYRGQFPFMAIIGYQNVSMTGAKQHLCGGTIINRRHILTAAHCMKQINGMIPVEVLLGEHDTAIDPDCSSHLECSLVKIYRIVDVFAHPQYDYSSSSNHDHDIAIIRVDRDIEYDEVIQPVCLPFVVDYDLENFPPKLDRVNDGIITGWGRTGSNAPASTVLRFAKVPIVSNELCEIDYYQFSQVTSAQICAGGVEGVDSCGGDSGGPIMILHREASWRVRKLFQVGITSYGTTFCARGVPSVYTRISSYLRWILDSIQP